jgi:hypothetical protein
LGRSLSLAHHVTTITLQPTYMHRLHAGLTLAIPIRQGESKKLEQILEKFAADEENFIQNLENSKTTLFVSCVILPEQTSDKSILPPTLVFATTFSGPFRIHLNELIKENYENLCSIFQYCEKFPDDAFCSRKKLSRYLRRRQHLHTFNSRYNCKTKEVIKNEKVLINKIEEYLDSDHFQIDFNAINAVEVKSMIQGYILTLGPDYAWARKADKKSFFEKFLSNRYKYPLMFLAGLILLIVPANYMILLILSVITGILMVGVVAIAIVMYITRKTFPTSPRPSDCHVRALAASQLRPVINEMTAAAPLKSGVTRMFFFAIALRFVQNFKRSRLEVPTVSNIRWLVVNKWKRLLFLSSYTNTTDFYVREFLTGSTPSGVNFMFTNGLGFPDAKLLFEGGISEDPEGYMNVIHTHQRITNLWYAHDYHITADIINKNAKVRNGLFEKMDEDDARNWLMLL